MRTNLTNTDLAILKTDLIGRVDTTLDEFKQLVEGGPDELQKLRVGELKKFITFLKIRKNAKLRVTGKKSELIERIASFIYPDYQPRQTTPQMSTSGTTDHMGNYLSTTTVENQVTTKKLRFIFLEMWC